MKPPINEILGGLPTNKTRSEKIRRKDFPYGSISTNASRTMAKPTMLNTL